MYVPKNVSSIPAIASAGLDVLSHEEGSLGLKSLDSLTALFARSAT